MSLGDNDIGNTGTMGVESFSVDILNSPTRNLSPSHERSRSRSYERRHRSRSSSQRRSRSPRNRNNRSRSRDRYRDRNRRSDNSRRNGNRSSVQQSQQLDRELGLKYRWEKTVYVSNIPYETRWTDLKDLFRDKVGDVMYCEVFEKDGRSLGVGAVEFKTESDAERAVKIMHQYDLGNRKISVRIDGEGFKTRQAKEQVLEDSRNKKSKNQPTDTALAIAKALSGGQGNLLGLLGMGGGGSASLMGNFGGASASLNPQQNMLNQLAAQLKVDGPVTNRIFVASLDYKVDEDKIKEVFSMAGRVQSCQMFRDRDGKSRG